MGKGCHDVSAPTNSSGTEPLDGQFEHITIEDYSDTQPPSHAAEPIQERIDRVREDITNIQNFYNVEISPARRNRLKEYYEDELDGLNKAPFDDYDQEEKVDYHLLKSFLKLGLWELTRNANMDEKMDVLLPFAPTITRLIEDRQQGRAMNAKEAAQDLFEIQKHISMIEKRVTAKKIEVEKFIAFRAVNTTRRLRDLLAEWFDFFKGYDPMFTWWVAEPYQKVDKALTGFADVVSEILVGVKPGDDDAIVGEPIGREGLMHDLDAEKIPYTPEELIKIGELEYEWCEKEMKKAAREIGYSNWRDALEHVKNLYVEPGEQPELISNLTAEATEYVKKNDLVTVPKICEETWQMFMMSPARQKVNPFFLGGTSIIVSYPTDTMNHEAKLMSLRGNNIHFARATVFHEMIPGHHLQMHMMARKRPYRAMFFTPFCTEGWSFYWEMILWDKKSWKKTPENRIGMLFWRMHRCARIIFSLKFHLGQMTPQECIDLLVDWVGHERATAEGEVRRSFNGDYRPLYQAGYMLGGLQLYALRKEVVDTGNMSEKQFHDRFLVENQMPVELFRVLIREKPLDPDFKASWRFYPSI